MDQTERLAATHQVSVRRLTYGAWEVIGPMAEKEILEERIRLRAYHLWLDAGGLHGTDVDHWLEAEKEEAETAPHTPSEIPLEIKFLDPA
jgi:hypothetical protein